MVASFRPNDSTLAGYAATLQPEPRPDEELLCRPGGVVLEVLAGADKGERFELEGRSRITVGRGYGNDVTLTDGSVSNSHLELRLNEQGVTIRELGSSNGTWVGKVQILGEARLRDGAEFYVGDCKLRLASVGMVDVAVSRRTTFGSLRGASPEMRELFAQLVRLAQAPLSVLILGETGTGKELVARALHSESSRASKPFVVLDCGSIPSELAEATIMGYRKGAFTGAVRDTPGCFEDADGGVLFLDELGELSPELQPKLLRVLDRQEVQRIGETRPRKIDVRVLAATNRDLRKMVATEKFRLDLYHRLAQVTLSIPPLRERPEDIGLLARTFLEQFSKQTEREMRFSDDALPWLKERFWEGNVRELKMLVQSAAYLAPGSTVSARVLAQLRAGETAPASSLVDVDDDIFARPLKEAGDQALEQFQHEYCRRLLASTREDSAEAARRAGYSVKGFRELLRRLGLYSS